MDVDGEGEAKVKEEPAEPAADDAKDKDDASPPPGALHYPV